MVGVNVSFTRASFLNMRADHSFICLVEQNFFPKMDDFVTILLYFTLANCPKIATLCHFLKFFFLKIFGFI